MLYHSLERLIHIKNVPDGIQAMYVNTVLRRLGLSIIGIFYPVFVFLRTQDTFGESFVVGMYGVIVYFLIWQLVKFVITIPTAKFVSVKGYRRTMALGNFFLVLLLLLLTVSEGFFTLLLVAAVLHAFATSFYWTAFHSLFADDGVVEDLGEELSVMKLLERLSNIIGPAVGGLVLTIWGFHQLFMVALVVILFSVIPFFFMHKHEHKEKLKVADIVDWLEKKRHRGEMLGNLGKHMDDKIQAIFWPIFVFSIVGTFSRQGFVEAFALILGSISVFLAGYIFDKRHSRFVFKQGVTATAVLTMLRGFVSTFGGIIVIDALRKIFSPYYWITFDTLWYEHSKRKKENVLVYAVMHQLFAAIATFIVLGVAFIFIESKYFFWVMWILSTTGVLFSLSIWPAYAKASKGKSA